MTVPASGLSRANAAKTTPKAVHKAVHKAGHKAGPGTGSLAGDLRALRRARALTLTEVATALDRSVGWISQVERGLSEPSLSDLRRLAALFEVPLGFFFSNDEAEASERGYIVRHANRRTLGERGDGLLEELLSSGWSRAIPSASTMNPSAGETLARNRPW